MRSQVVIKIPSSEPWVEMQGYLLQWKLKLPQKLVCARFEKHSAGPSGLS